MHLSINGSGYGYGYGYGCGYGCGYGDGYGDGSGSGYGKSASVSPLHCEQLVMAALVANHHHCRS